MHCTELQALPPASAFSFAITETDFGSVTALLCPQESCRATTHGFSEQTWGEAPQTHLSCGCRPAVAELNCPQFETYYTAGALCGQLRSHPSLYAPSLPFLLPIVPSRALGGLLPVSSCLLLSLQFLKDLNQVGGRSWVTCKTQRGIQPLAGEEQVPSVALIAERCKRSLEAR